MKKSNSKQQAPFQKNALRAGGYSTVLSLVVIAVAIAVNLFVSALPANLIKFDNSAIDLYTLSDVTKNIVSALQEDVTIYLIAPTGAENTVLTEYLDQYKALSPHIKVQYVDPVVRPNFVGQYTEEKLNNNSLIVESARRSKVIPIEEIYVTSYGYDPYYNVVSNQSFDGENSLTGAIDFVTTESIPTVYILTGHGEATLNETVLDYMDIISMNVDTLNLMKTDGIPENADCILIYNPKQDISEYELNLIRDYVKDGGNLMLITSAAEIKKEPLQNLDVLMKEYGTSTQAGVVKENDTRYHFSLSSYYLIPVIKSHAITAPLTAQGYDVLMPNAQGIIVDEVLPEGVTVTTLLSTTDKATLVVESDNTTENSDTDSENTDGENGGEPAGTSYAVGVAITAGNGKAVWFSADLTNTLYPPYINSTPFSNYYLFLTALNWMCGDKSSVSIPSVSLAATPLSISQAESNIWTAIVCGIIPVGILATGLVVWTKRRKR